MKQSPGSSVGDRQDLMVRSPSRPPAPLLSGAGDDFITISMKLDTNDSIRGEDVIGDIIRYEVQMEKRQTQKKRDHQNVDNVNFAGIWKDVLFDFDIKPSSNGMHRPASATVTDLVPGECYRCVCDGSNEKFL